MIWKHYIGKASCTCGLGAMATTITIRLFAIPESCCCTVITGKALPLARGRGTALAPCVQQVQAALESNLERPCPNYR